MSEISCLGRILRRQHTHYERKTLRCGHLYQLFAYVKNLEARAGPDSCAEGILLYPAVEHNVDF